MQSDLTKLLADTIADATGEPSSTGKRSKRSKRAAKPATPKPDAAPAVTGPLTAGQLARRNDTVARMLYPFGTASNRDDAFAALYAFAANEHGSGDNKRTVTLAALASCGAMQPNGRARNPFADMHAIPSAPICDAGALQRAVKRGFIAHDHGSASYTLTDAGAEYGSAMLHKLAKPV